MDFLNNANTPQNLLKKNKKPQPVLLAQGTYGCVYYPGFTCTGKIQKKKYVTKIQKNNETLQNELEIGDKIKKIKLYENYFAPILKQCPVSISKLQSQYPEAINQCKVISEELNPQPQSSQQQQQQQNGGKNTVKMPPSTPPPPTSEGGFNINKIKYILGKDLDQTFEEQKLLPDSEYYIPSFLLDTYDYLSKALKKIQKENILHYDLKANNIIYDKESNIPIIIDFGLSIQLDKINPQTPDPEIISKLFFDTYKYDYWCLDEIFVGVYAAEYYEYFTQSPESKETYYQKKVSEQISEKYKETINNYINYAYVFKPEFLNKLSQVFPHNQTIQTKIQTFTKTFHDKWHKYVTDYGSYSLLNFFQYTWEARYTWDYYSLAVIYLEFISQLNPLPPILPTSSIKIPRQLELETLTENLLNQILALPNERKALILNLNK